MCRDHIIDIPLASSFEQSQSQSQSQSQEPRATIIVRPLRRVEQVFIACVLGAMAIYILIPGGCQ